MSSEWFYIAFLLNNINEDLERRIVQCFWAKKDYGDFYKLTCKGYK